MTTTGRSPGGADGEPDSPASVAKDVAEDVAESTALDWAARFGFAVTGIVHILIGGIALGIPFGGSGEADPSGAIAVLADQPYGPLLLWACAAGGAGLSVWQLGEATISARHLPARKRAAKGVSSGWLFITYGALAVSIAHFALGQRSTSRQSTRDFTVTIIGWPLGPALLIGVGLLVIGIGVYFVIKGGSKKFKSELHVADSRGGKLVTGLGVVGHVAKGIALILAGLLVVVATWQ
ncbi:MAG TPA: DUF1206 domain-containing protein, partial [Micrococcaceae bacterium]